MFIREIIECPKCGKEMGSDGVCRHCGHQESPKSLERMEWRNLYYCSSCMREIEEDEVCPHCGYDNCAAENSSQALSVNTILNGRYKLGAVLGHGGFGITYAAWDKELGLPVAIKEFFPSDVAYRDVEYTDEVKAKNEVQYAVMLERFKGEMRTLANLRKLPGVVSIQDRFEANATAYIVMEYLYGQTLKEYVKANKPTARALLRMLEPTVSALVQIHRKNLLHRDIKPENLMVLEDGSIKLIDFGAASEMGKEESIVAYRTIQYAAIEQCEEEHEYGIGPWTDIYALCATIYEMLAGEGELKTSVQRLLRDDQKPIGKIVKLKRYEAQAITDGLTVNPEKRIQSMAELEAMLYNKPLPEELRRRRRLMRRMAVAMGIFMLALLMLFVNFTWGLPLGEGLLYTLYPDGWHVRGEYAPQEERVIGPSKCFLPVAQIEDRVFMEDAVLKSVTIAGSVKKIGDQAFRECVRLEMATVEDGVEEIGDWAFMSCESLYSLVLPQSVVRITANVCEDANPLLVVWGELDWEALGLTDGEDVPHYASRQDWKIAPNETGVTLTAYNADASELLMPSIVDGQWVTQIACDGEGALALPADIVSVVLPERVSYLGTGVLSEKEQLEYVRLGAGMRELGARALYGSAISRLDANEGLLTIGDEALADTRLSEFEFPSTLQTIGKSAFKRSELERIDLPDSVTRVGQRAFSRMGSLTDVKLSSEMDRIEDMLFSLCTKLKNVNIPESILEIGYGAFWGCNEIEYLYIPDGVKTIELYAFRECISLSYICLPESLEVVNNHIFTGCPSDLIISGKSNSSAQKVAELQNYTFEDPNELLPHIAVFTKGEIFVFGEFDEEEIWLPSYVMKDKIITVGRVEDNSLRIVHLPKFTESIGGLSFRNSKALEFVDVPSTLKDISLAAFYGCDNLQQFDFPEAMETIDAYAFANCSSLASPIFPDSIHKIENNAFDGCSGITEIVLPASLAVLRDASFAHTSITSVVVPGNVSVCGATFYQCDQLRSAVLEEGVRILEETFYDCSALESVVLPSTLEAISGYTFSGCTSLKDVTFYADNLTVLSGANISAIGMYDGGKHIVSIPIGPSVRPLDHMFADCPDVVIHAHRGSTMETYAIEHGLNFEPLD